MSRASLKSVSRLIDILENKENTPVEAQFLDDLKRSIELTDAKGIRPVSQTFKPSSMNCMRNSYFQLIGAMPDVEPRSFTSIGITNSGSDIHERVQQAVCDMHLNSMDCEYVDVNKFVLSRNLVDLEVKAQKGFETKLYNKRYNISFMCDGIISYKGRYYILEIKTEASSKWYSRDGVDPKHYQQATAYSLSMGLDNVIFLYVDRDMLNMKSFMFHVTDDMRNEMVNYIETVQGYVERNIVPPKGDISRNVCQYCGYQNICKR